MTISVSVAVMAHPSRQKMVGGLLDALDRPAQVVWDMHNDRWETGTRALQTYVPNSTHHLVIQDDAVPCRDLVAGVERLLPLIPDGCPMVLYTGVYRKFISEMNQAYMQKPFDWLLTPGILWGVGVVVPTSDISDIISYCEGRPEQNYDMRMSRYYENVKKCWVWAPIPSLVDHRDGPSLVAGRKGGRRAWRFIGAEKSALELPLSGRAQHLKLIRSIDD